MVRSVPPAWHSTFFLLSSFSQEVATWLCVYTRTVWISPCRDYLNADLIFFTQHTSKWIKMQPYFRFNEFFFSHDKFIVWFFFASRKDSFALNWAKLNAVVRRNILPKKILKKNFSHWVLEKLGSVHYHDFDFLFLGFVNLKRNPWLERITVAYKTVKGKFFARRKMQGTLDCLSVCVNLANKGTVFFFLGDRSSWHSKPDMISGWAIWAE